MKRGSCVFRDPLKKLQMSETKPSCAIQSEKPALKFTKSVSQFMVSPNTDRTFEVKQPTVKINEVKNRLDSRFLISRKESLVQIEKISMKLKNFHVQSAVKDEPRAIINSKSTSFFFQKNVINSEPRLVNRKLHEVDFSKKKNNKEKMIETELNITPFQISEFETGNRPSVRESHRDVFASKKSVHRKSLTMSNNQMAAHLGLIKKENNCKVNKKNNAPQYSQSGQKKIESKSKITEAISIELDFEDEFLYKTHKKIIGTPKVRTNFGTPKRNEFESGDSEHKSKVSKLFLGTISRSNSKSILKQTRSERSMSSKKVTFNEDMNQEYILKEDRESRRSSLVKHSKRNSCFSGSLMYKEEASPSGVDFIRDFSLSESKDSDFHCIY